MWLFLGSHMILISRGHLPRPIVNSIPHIYLMYWDPKPITSLMPDWIKGSRNTRLTWPELTFCLLIQIVSFFLDCIKNEENVCVNTEMYIYDLREKKNVYTEKKCRIVTAMHFHCYVCDTMCHFVVVHGVEATSLPLCLQPLMCGTRSYWAGQQWGG